MGKRQINNIPQTKMAFPFFALLFSLPKIARRNVNFFSARQTDENYGNGMGFVVFEKIDF